ncbi:bifunctional demethylmenaquinone methyltransferase/2-methoxy-6-polyprenyl-1,4-benzoquinol methylase UbiE [Thermodesulfobacteriota bacterium]
MRNPISYELDDHHPQARKRFIQQLFDAIVPTYDLLNRVLSMGTDVVWRRNIFRHIPPLQGQKVIDLCCGTGDLSALLHRKGGQVVSLDFSLKMLQRGIKKKALPDQPVAADASRLPFKRQSFDFACIAFGIRNIPDINTFINAVGEVLAPNGKLVVLELTRPHNKMVRTFYRLYLEHLLPLVGGLVSGQPLAYRYLSRTIATFVEPAELEGMLSQGGFARVDHFPQSFGIATITVACKESP